MKGKVMTKINIAEKLSRFDALWTPKRVGRINDTDVKLVKVKGEFVWHHHDQEDELFLVIKGRLLMQFRDHEEWIEEGELIIVPRGIEHRPVAPEEVHMMLIEPATTLNTGNIVNERTVEVVEVL
jgi:mannose-6-phosphate isomerase-like protein (cupin superfamily)